MNGNRMHRCAGTTIILLACVPMVAGCLPANEEKGRVSASRFGHLPAQPLERTVFDTSLRSACGTGVIENADAFARQPYLQQVEDDSAMLVWTAVDADPMEVLVTRPDGEVVTTAQSTLDEVEYLDDASQHIVEIDALKPSTTYCYTIRDDGRTLTAPTGFVTAPPVGEDVPVTFLAVGDMGTGDEDQAAVFEQMKGVEFDLLVTMGDNAYPDGTLSQYERKFFDMYAPMLRSVPVYPISGNHEYLTDDAGPFREVFALPRNGGPGAVERWYSFDWGPVHFVALDTQLMNEEQANWLENDLAATDQKWTVVMAHKPPYSSGHRGSTKRFRRVFGPIIEKYEVPLVLSGHDHNYERTHPMNGTTYIVTGGGGKATRDIGSSGFTAHSDEVLHFMWARVDGDRLELRAIDATGTEFDSVVITHPDAETAER